MNNYYLVLDQGGQGSRAALFDGAGQLLQLHTRVVDSQYPHPGWVEQNPLQIVDSLQQCLSEIELPADGDISAALVTQRSSLVCWDRISGEPLSAVLSWQDTRAGELLETLAIDPSELRERTGLYPSPHFGASKIRWCLEHLEPVQQAKAAGRLCIGPLSSFLLFKLLPGRPFAVDAANASRTLLYNIQQGNWDPELLALFTIPGDILPAVVPSFSDWGALPVGERAVAMKLVSGDQSAAFAALSCDRPGAAVINAGTGAFIARSLAQGCRAPDRLLQTLVLEEGGRRFIAEGTVNGAASALEWAAEQLQLENYQALDIWAQQWLNVPLFLNGVGGLAAPFWRREFPSRFIGSGTGEEKLVAVLESVVFLLHCNLQQMINGDMAVDHLRVAGGLSKLDSFCQKLADLCQLNVYRPQLAEATAFGAAWLLAGRPQWLQQQVLFQPGIGSDALSKRYQQWLKEMDKNL